MSEKEEKIEQLINSANYWKAEHLAGNKVIEQQAAEIEALRGFAQAMREYYSAEHRKGSIFESLAIEFGLVDKSGKPTKLLTGDSK